jgi:hypothetical protein
MLIAHQPGIISLTDSAENYSEIRGWSRCNNPVQLKQETTTIRKKKEKERNNDGGAG